MDADQVNQQADLVIRDFIHQKALDLGLSVVGFSAPEIPLRNQKRLDEVISNQCYGDMDWLSDRAYLRKSPRELWPEVKTAIVIGHSYSPPFNPLELLEQKNKGAISVYAMGRDYHNIIKGRMKTLCQQLQSHLSLRYPSKSDGEKAKFQVKVFVDTAPLMEKPLAQKAGIGWQGKHTNLVSREHGSWLFLGVILTDLPLAPSELHQDHCGSCQQCMTICPTNAIPKPYHLEPDRCIAYLTIEHQGSIPREYRKAIGNRIYGCDDCLAICPWNKFAQTSQEIGYQAPETRLAPKLADLLELDDQKFRDLFSQSPVKRTGWLRFLRNCLIAAGNSDDQTLIPYCKGYLRHERAMIREAAVWALGQLHDQEMIIDYEEFCRAETNASVIAEWQQSFKD